MCLCEANHLKKAPLYVRGTLKCNFDRMRVSNPAVEMSSGFLGLEEWRTPQAAPGSGGTRKRLSFSTLRRPLPPSFTSPRAWKISLLHSSGRSKVPSNIQQVVSRSGAHAPTLSLYTIYSIMLSNL